MHRALTTRTGALTLAIILAAAAALMVFVYVKGYQSDVNGRGTEVSVLVANQTVPQLTPGNQVVEATMYRTTTVPKSSLVDGAVTNPDQLAWWRGTTSIPVTADDQPVRQVRHQQRCRQPQAQPAGHRLPGRAWAGPGGPAAGGRSRRRRRQLRGRADRPGDRSPAPGRPVDPGDQDHRQGRAGAGRAGHLRFVHIGDAGQGRRADAGHQCQRRSARGVRAAEGRHLLRPPPAWQLRRCPARDRRRPQRASRHQRRPAPVHHSGQGALA